MQKKRRTAIIAAIVAVMSMPINSLAMEVEKGATVIGNGINYIQKKTSSGSTYSDVQVIKMDPKNQNNKLVFSKARNTAVGSDSLQNQIAYVESKGDKVVGAINGDFFNKGSGIGLGPHINNGIVVSSYASLWDQERCPVLNVDKDNKVSIDTLETKGKIRIMNKINSNLNKTQRESEDIDFFAVNRYDFYKASEFELLHEVVVLTPNYSDSRVLSPMEYAPDDLFVVVQLSKSLSAPLREGGLIVGEEYIGEITQVVKGSKVTIPKDGFVLASSGNKTKILKDNANVGKEVRVKFDFNKPNVEKVISGHSYLVEDGKAYDNNYFKNKYESKVVNQDSVRTGIGLDKEGNVIGVTTKDSVSLHEFAKIMKNLGAVNAINLDGGGSTQMHVKQYNKESNTVKSIISSGNQRAISNGILFVSNAKGQANFKSINIQNGFNIYKGSKYKLGVEGEDVNYDKIKLNPKDLKWSVNNSVATINKEGELKAGNKYGKAEVTVSKGSATDKVTITIIDKLKDIEMNIDSNINVKKGDKIELQIKGEGSNHKDIFIDKNLAQFTITPELGKVNNKGEVVITATEGEGYIKVKVGNVTKDITVSVGQKSKPNDSEEHSKDEVIKFPDKNLEKGIRAAIGKSEGDICKGDVEWLTDLRLPNSNISNLEGMQHLTNLRVLYLHINNIKDITPLKNLTEITHLSLFDNQIENITALENMTELKSLNLYSNKITNLKALTKATKLKEVWLHENKITDISGIENAKELTFLSLYMNKIKDIKPLSNLKSLEQLLLEYNEIVDVTPLKNLTNLNRLGLKRNKIVDTSALKGLKNLKSLDI